MRLNTALIFTNVIFEKRSDHMWCTQKRENETWTRFLHINCIVPWSFCYFFSNLHTFVFKFQTRHTHVPAYIINMQKLFCIFLTLFSIYSDFNISKNYEINHAHKYCTDIHSYKFLRKKYDHMWPIEKKRKRNLKEVFA
jgi:hypothetical protein